jgi:hypothetical protein
MHFYFYTTTKTNNNGILLIDTGSSSQFFMAQAWHFPGEEEFPSLLLNLSGTY